MGAVSFLRPDFTLIQKSLLRHFGIKAFVNILIMEILEIMIA